MISLIIDEAAADSSLGTILFKIQLSSDSEESTTLQGTFLRNFFQISWLHDRLTSTYPQYIVPSLPDSPNSASLTELEYIEKKKRQVQRLLIRLLRRKEFHSAAPVLHFFSSEMVAFLNLADR